MLLHWLASILGLIDARLVKLFDLQGNVFSSTGAFILRCDIFSYYLFFSSSLSSRDCRSSFRSFHHHMKLETSLRFFLVVVITFKTERKINHLCHVKHRQP